MTGNFNLPVEIAGVKFRNPFYVASGPTTKSVEQLKKIEECGWGAASIKLTIDPAPYINRVPRYAIFKDRNALCFTVEKRLKFEEGLKLMRDAKKELKGDLKLMANITYAGDKGVAGWVNMAVEFEKAGADIIELNMCCPNMSFNLQLSQGDDNASKIKTGASLGQNGDAVAEIVREIKKSISIPLFVKLTPEGGRIAQIATALYAAGADAVGGTSNRMALPPINLDHPEKAPYHLQDEISMSCHCGSWVKPLALRDTYEIRKVNGPEPKIMMAGGVRNWRDACEMFMAGADLVGICSETLISGYGFIGDLIDGVRDFMDSHGYSNTREMRDLILPHVRTAADVTLYKGYSHVKGTLAAPCKSACPANVPAQAYVNMIAQKNFKRAYELIVGAAPLMGICGVVCSHPCELSCTRGITGRSIQIRDLKRFTLEQAKKNGWKPDLVKAKANGKKIAVIGSGPAGISAAFYLAKAGYGVTVFEKENYLGGMLRYAIPNFRLDKSLIDDEIAILKELGVEFKTGVMFGKDITAESLKKDGFDSVFMGVGAQSGRLPGIPGEDAKGVFNAVDFLKDVYDGKKISIGDDVVILGGGFTAVDAARTARRLGAKNVYIAYRRTRDEMPATAEEIAEAEAEGVKIMYLVAPTEIVAANGKVSAIKMTTQVLGESDTSGRRRPEAVCGAEFTLKCDTVVAAIGQVPCKCATDGIKTTRSGMIAVNEWNAVDEFIYAGGDAVEVRNIISAVADGRRAAYCIDFKLTDGNPNVELVNIADTVDPYAVLRRNPYFTDNGAVDLDTKAGAERVKNFDTFRRVMTEDEAVKEASRCLKCGCGEGCQLCKTICTDFAVDIVADDTMQINKDKCVACGMCYNRCPNGNIEMIDLGIKA
ncbi:MAG: FAD-dependent oxidoreductase [Oscillospiraceae bacterium]|nr:FAD-dependent oxidoreductase [Oscillospiraceae bacterium]